MKKLTFALAACALLSTVFTSCNDKDDEPTDKLAVEYTFTFSSDNFNGQGYWKDVYNTEIGNFGVTSDLGTATAILTHSASADEWDGVKYYSFVGFCPTMVNDRNDYSASGDWASHQWSTIATLADNQTYLIAHWDVSETAETALSARSCGIDLGNGCQPVSIKVSNTSWGYWAMKNGSAFSKAFGASDWCILTVHGVGYDRTERTIDVYLAKNGDIMKDWITVDLTPLGSCGSLYFTMSSSDTGQWGMNNPAYFALSAMNLVYTY